MVFIYFLNNAFNKFIVIVKYYKFLMFNNLIKSTKLLIILQTYLVNTRQVHAI